MTKFSLFDIFNVFASYGIVTGGTNTNICVIESTDGTWYGYDSSVPIGAIDPVYTADGTFTYALKWKADGTIVAKYGDAGNEQLTDVDGILVKNSSRNLLLQWDDLTKDYRTVDQPLTDYLISTYEDGNKRCFEAEILPDLFINYTLSEIRTGTK